MYKKFLLLTPVCLSIIQAQTTAAEPTQGDTSFFLIIVVAIIVFGKKRGKSNVGTGNNTRTIEDDKILKIKEDGTIVRVDENSPDSKTEIIYCPYFGKR